jgi:hypothetical protein
LSRRALDFNNGRFPDADAFGEVPFGGAEPKSDATIPWDPAAIVEIPGAGFRIKGYIGVQQKALARWPGRREEVFELRAIYWAVATTL